MSRTPTTSSQKTPHSRKKSAKSAKSSSAKKSKITRGSLSASASKNASRFPRFSSPSFASPVPIRPEPKFSHDGILHRDRGKEFYAFVDLIPRTDTYASFKNDESYLETCRLQVGDFACIQVSGQNDSDRDIYPPGEVRKAPPFNVRWRPCQILSIYRDMKSDLGSMKVEVRWFYRISDLDSRNRTYESSQLKDRKIFLGDELLESGHVGILDACLLLGKLTLENDKNAWVSKKSSSNDEFPSLVYLCYRYYLHEEEDIFEFYDRDLVSRGFESSLLLRKSSKLREETFTFLNLSPSRIEDGDDDTEKDNVVFLPSHSLHIKYNRGDKWFYPSCLLAYPWSTMSGRNLICPPHRRIDFPKWKLCVGDVIAVQLKATEATPPIGADHVASRQIWYPYSVPWSHAQVVAIYRDKIDETEPPQEGEATSLRNSSVNLQVRWFYRLSEAIKETNSMKILQQLKGVVHDSERNTEAILEANELSDITSESILGPVRIDSRHINHRKSDGRLSHDDDSPACPYLVQNRRVCDYLFPSMRKVEDRAETLLERGINKCVLYKNRNQRNKIMHEISSARGARAKQMENFSFELSADEIKSDACSSPEADPVSSPGNEVLPKKRRLFERRNDVVKTANQPSFTESFAKKLTPHEAASHLGDNPRVTTERGTAAAENPPSQRVSCKKHPFHVDLSSLKSFYDEIEIQPPVDCYHDMFRSQTATRLGEIQWTVKIGDTVTLEVEAQTKVAAMTYFPFNVPWSPCEVVSIYRIHDSKDDCLKLRSDTEEENHVPSGSFNFANETKTNDVMLEIRWLYKRHEIPGEGKSSSFIPFEQDQSTLEEVFETDHIEVCSADSILSPLVLHESKCPSVKLVDSISGMPCINFYCSRFYSIHRKSFVPSGSHATRVERGRMHSVYFGKHGSAKAALRRLHNGANEAMKSTSHHKDISWKEAFQSAIKTLSLAEAAQDIHMNKMELTCREDERKLISSFLRSAICGKKGRQDNDDGENGTNKSTKHSILVAGPPGTGKTASVRSIITELQEAQVKGEIPEFKFIELNGMEMRNAYDAYIKFWEALSGVRKEKLSAPAAAAKLDNYFSSRDNNDDSTSDFDIDIDRKPVIVLLLDEIDYLVTRNMTVLYSFFDWPLRTSNNADARLIVIGISNTINLADRLSTKMSSRLGNERVNFNAYDAENINRILTKRLGMSGDDRDPANDVFDTDALQYAARKTANGSGDVRKAFHMCKVAAESVYEEIMSGRRRIEDGSRPIVRTEDVSRGSRDLARIFMYKSISCSTNYQALVYIAIGALKQWARREDAKFKMEEIMTKIESISNSSGQARYDARLSWSDLIGMLNRLGDAGVIVLSPPPLNATNTWPLISTCLNHWEILSSFRGTTHYQLAKKHIDETRQN